MRSVISALLFLHGLLHVVGFVGPLELVPQARLQTVLLGRSIPNTSPMARSLGVVWLLLTLAFSVASVAVFVHASWWFPFTTLLLLASLLLCLATLPTNKACAALDAGLLMCCFLFERAQLWTDLLALLRTLAF